jgi:hypothetical protein
VGLIHAIKAGRIAAHCCYWDCAKLLDSPVSFFEKLLGSDEVAFSRWRSSGAPLPPGGEETLRDLWRAVLHLLSFLNFDPARVRELFQKTMPACPSGAASPSPLSPPWSGASLKAYHERARADGIGKVAGWVTGLRFGDPYAA